MQDEKAKEATLEPSQSATVDAATVQDEDESNDADENDLAAAGAKVGLKIIKRRTSLVRVRRCNRAVTVTVAPHRLLPPA